MYRKEVNERSPMRVFENSMHGGLGRGNLGVIAARPGVGKTPLLVQIALDDLMRDRKVLHISHENAVDHVRAYYDEIFHDLVQTTHLEAADDVRLDIERNRLIFSHLGTAKNAPMSMRGGESSIEKIRTTVRFARETAEFIPDAIVIDGFDFEHCSEAGVRALRDLAADLSVELWASAKTTVPAKQIRAVPAPIDKFASLISVVVLLEPDTNHVRLRLLKDHDNKDIADVHLRLDPHSMRVIDEDVPAQSERPRSPRRFRLHSGGARGSEAAFGACAERWGMTEINYSFDGHRLLDRTRGVQVLTTEQLKKGDFSLVFASKRLGRVLSDIPLVRSVLQTIWHQITNSNQVFVVGFIQEDGTVRGGTGWGAELARLWRKPLFVYDQEKRGWFRWAGKAWEMAQSPTITSENFCGTGTQHLSDDGRDAIRALFVRSFGEPTH
jgi:hypothetical protein